MRSLSWTLSALVGLAALGCSSNPTTPADSQNDSPRLPQASLGNAVVEGDRLVMPIGLYNINIDRTTLTATVEMKQGRQAAGAGDDTYELCVNDFFPAPPMKITDVEISSDSLHLRYKVHHPFPAPNDWTAPASASNRADLAISGQCVWLVDATADGMGLEPSTYFVEAGTPNSGVTAVFGFITNAHTGPGDLRVLDTTGFTCNAFPTLPLVDETNPDCRTSSRTGAVITSSGDTGNYNAATGGWQRGNIGSQGSENGGTGYSVLHQGQACSGIADLDLDGLAALDASGEGISLDMAIVAHYNDPRGGTTPAEKKRNRLPSATGDPAVYFYSMPDGTCPVTGVVVEQPTPWSAAATVVPIRCEVKDWFGAGGRVSVCIPGVLGDNSVSVELVSTPTGTGTPSDPLVWQEDITLPPGVTPGTYKGIIQYERDVAVDDETIPLKCDLSSAGIHLNLHLWNSSDVDFVVTS